MICFIGLWLFAVVGKITQRGRNLGGPNLQRNDENTHLFASSSQSLPRSPPVDLRRRVGSHGGFRWLHLRRLLVDAISLPRPSLPSPSADLQEGGAGPGDDRGLQIQPFYSLRRRLRLRGRFNGCRQQAFRCLLRERSLLHSAASGGLCGSAQLGYSFSQTILSL